MTTHVRARRERGGAAMLLLLVLILAVAVLGTLAIRGSVADLGIAGTQERGKLAFYCAEAGLNAARGYFGQNLAQWPTMFAANAPYNQAAPAGYPFSYSISAGHDQATAAVTIADDVDEFPPLANDPLHDNNLSAVLTSTCTTNDGTQHVVKALFVFTGQAPKDYIYQSGHSSSHSGNEN